MVCQGGELFESEPPHVEKIYPFFHCEGAPATAAIPQLLAKTHSLHSYPSDLYLGDCFVVRASLLAMTSGRWSSVMYFKKSSNCGYSMAPHDGTKEWYKNNLLRSITLKSGGPA